MSLVFNKLSTVFSGPAISLSYIILLNLKKKLKNLVNYCFCPVEKAIL